MNELRSNNQPVEPFAGESPYSPGQLRRFGILFGPLPVVMMGAMNWRRLGQKKRLWLLFVLAICGLALSTLIATKVLIDLTPDFSPVFGGPLFVALMGGLLGYLMAGWINKRQHTDMAVWQARYHPTTTRKRTRFLRLAGVLLVSYLVTAVILILLSPVWSFSTAFWLDRQFHPGGSVQTENFSLSYPVRWKNDPALCKQQEECRFVFVSSYQGGQIIVGDLTRELPPTMTITAYDGEFWKMMVAQIPFASSPEPEALQVDGQEALRRTIDFNAVDGTPFRTITVLIWAENGARISIQANAIAEDFSHLQPAFETIFNSIRFK